MKVAILCQEEPVFLGPWLIAAIESRPRDVVAVFVAGSRGGGERRRGWGQKIESFRTYRLILGSTGFAAALALRARAAVLGRLDPRSVERAARRNRIPVHRVGDPNGAEFVRLLREVAPDAVLNQSELLLKPEVLAIPRLGFLNRHASLLPEHRGRMGAFWAHAAERPRYGVTIHRVDAGIDTGPIVVQREFADIPPTASYPAVMKRLCREAPALFWEAVDRIETEGARPQPLGGGEPRRFPTLAEARAYRERLSERRRGARG